MEKFSRVEKTSLLAPKPTDKQVYDGKYLKVIDNGSGKEWVKSHDKIFVLPYLMYEASVIMNHEQIPSFSHRYNGSSVAVDSYYLTAVGGSIDGDENPISAMKRELAEEAGLILSDMKDFDVEGPYFPCKESGDRYYLCVMKLNPGEYKFVSTHKDGSGADGNASKPVKVSIGDLNDIIVHDMITKQLIDLLKKECNMK